VKSDDRDRELARLFGAARRADESAAPELEKLLERSRTRRPTSAGRRITYAAAIACLVTVAILLVRDGARRRIAPAAETPQLADWQSPTDFLLDTPGSDLLTELPTLASLPNAENASSPEITKGVSR
jgi:hypothetical protein